MQFEPRNSTLVGLVVLVACIFIVAFVIIMLLAYTGPKEIKPDEPGHQENSCCSVYELSNVSSSRDFYQGLMGRYVPYLNDLKLVYVSDNGTSVSYPVYFHVIGGLNYQGEHAFLYYYRDKNETNKRCPIGCWMIGMYNPKPDNFWFGQMLFFDPKGTDDPCPESLESVKWLNFSGNLDEKLRLSCVD